MTCNVNSKPTCSQRMDLFIFLKGNIVHVMSISGEPFNFKGGIGLLFDFVHCTTRKLDLILLHLHLYILVVRAVVVFGVQQLTPSQDSQNIL